MNNLSRRSFVSFALASTSLLAMPAISTGSARPKVVVVGGGAGGATAARYLSLIHI